MTISNRARRYERVAPIIRQHPRTAALESAICDSLADAPASVYELAEELGASVDRIERCIQALTWSGLIEVAWLAKPWTGRPKRVFALTRTRRLVSA